MLVPMRDIKWCIPLIQLVNLKACMNKKIFINLNLLFYRFWLSWIGSKICEDLLFCYNLWQNNQGQGSQICRHVVSYWRNYGTPHWVLHHQWSGDCLLWNQDHPQNNNKEEIECLWSNFQLCMFNTIFYLLNTNLAPFFSIWAAHKNLPSQVLV